MNSYKEKFSLSTFALAFVILGMWSVPSYSQTSGKPAAGAKKPAAAASPSFATSSTIGATAPEMFASPPPPVLFATPSEMLLSEKLKARQKTDADSCLEQGSINMDDYLRLAGERLNKEKDTTMSSALDNLLMCWQMQYPVDNMCKADNVIEAPYFTRASDTVRAKTISKELMSQIGELADKLEYSCSKRALYMMFLRGDAVFREQNVPAGFCDKKYGYMNEYPADCENMTGNFLKAVAGGDNSICGSVEAGPNRFMCNLLTTKDPALCDSEEGLKYINPHDSCLDVLTAVKHLRNLPRSRKDKLLTPNPDLQIAVEYSKNPNYCNVLFEEKTLPVYCSFKDNASYDREIAEALEQEKKEYAEFVEQGKKRALAEKKWEEEQIKAAKPGNEATRLREEQDKKMEEAYQKKLEEKKKESGGEQDKSGVEKKEGGAKEGAPIK